MSGRRVVKGVASFLLNLGVIAALVVWAAPAEADDLRLEARAGGVAGVDATGAVLWTIAHHFDEDARRGFSALRFRPIVDGAHGYYAVRSDLITVDLRAGRVLERRRFPGVIEAMVAAEDGYLVTVLSRARKPHSALNVRYQPGARAPGTGLFEPILAWTSKLDALAAAGVEQHEEIDALSQSRLERGVESLGAAMRRDPTNLFLPLYRGRFFQVLGEEARAAKAFERAVSVGDAPWSDDIYGASLLARYGEGGRADALFKRGRRKMLARGVQPERLNHLVLQAILVQPLADAIGAARARQDAAQVDALLGHLAAIFPHPEVGALGWRGAADWMEAHGEPARADAWRARAAEVERAGAIAPALRSAREFDLGYLFFVSLLAALVLVPVGIGLRRPVRRLAGGRALPDIDLWDALGLVALMVGCALAPHYILERLQTTEALMSAPAEAFMNAYESPEFIDWLERLEPSEARATWLGYAREAQEALKLGSRALEPAPGAGLLVEAARAGVNAAPQRLVEAPIAARFSPPLAALASAIWVLLGILGGMLIRRFFSPLASALRLLIPGSARNMRLLAAPICALFAAAVLALFFRADRILTSIATPDYGRFFGLETLSPAAPGHGWAYIALAATLLVHMASTWWERANHRG